MKGIGSEFGRNVFVLDISYSMVGLKSETLQLSATRIIEDIPDNSYVGIVMFYGDVEMCHTITQITDRSVRDGLIRSVPTVLKGDTNIENGILYGVRALQDQNICTEGATMFLVTDGEDQTGTDYVSRVLPTLLDTKIKVVAIAIGNEADPNLERLAKETNGRTYFANGVNREMTARVIESTLQEVKTSKELAEAVNISVVDDIMRLTDNKVAKCVTIDSDIGRNTVFTIGSEDFDKISVSIQSPNGHTFDSTSNEMTRNEALKRFQLKPKTTEPGVWIISLNKHSIQTIGANISVKSQPLHPNAIQMKVKLRDEENNSPPLIVSQIRKGTDCVVGAEVTATVDKPDGTQSQLKLINYDNIYCNYFTDYCTSGRYNVSVSAQNKGSAHCQLKSLTSSTSLSSSMLEFERQLIAGCFKVTDPLPKSSAFALNLNSSLSSEFDLFDNSIGSIQTPAPRTAKAIIKPKQRAVPQTDDIIKAKEKIYDLLLLVKKSINSPKISDNERNVYQKTIDEIDGQINGKTIQELDNYLKQLEEFKEKLS